jgi:hypothetical protein
MNITQQALITRVKTYKKEPIAIQAIQFTGELENGIAIQAWSNEECVYQEQKQIVTNSGGANDPAHLRCTTRTGIQRANIGDYIIQGVGGEYYPCPKDVFEETYKEIPYDESGMNPIYDFGTIIKLLKEGDYNLIAYRQGWNGRGIYIKYVKEKEVNGIKHAPYLAINTVNVRSEAQDPVRGVVPWLASQTDILADDWVLTYENLDQGQPVEEVKGGN